MQNTLVAHSICSHWMDGVSNPTLAVSVGVVIKRFYRQ